ncbi:MAG: tripartite tricarboxylate transporter substrate binding protein [Alphaproteobacteria bacterium]|nr:tripartite tricarboxylate transporter substrate binding protein [Alphaproteobacteria bacterium]
MISRLALAAAAMAATLVAAPADAAWPEKPVRVVVPFGPGGTTDIVARFAQKLMEDKKILGQPMVVQNVGGHFSVGARQVMTAQPDGHTFLVIHLALLSGEVVDPKRGVSYRNFEPVALTGGFCFHPIVRQDSPYKSLRDVLDAAKAAPGTIVTGVNIGALNHMMGLFMEQGHPGSKFRYVQIGGGGENFAAIMGGHTQLTVLSSSEYQTYKANGIRALAYSGPERLKLEPEIPTARELGLGFDYCAENFWFAPKGTAKEAVDGMAAALEKATATAEMQGFFEKQAQTGQFLKGEAYARRLDEVFRAIEPVAKAAAPQQ